MSYDTEQAEYHIFNEEYIEAMQGPDCYEDCHPCDEKHIWYDEKLGIYRCRNCGWTN